MPVRAQPRRFAAAVSLLLSLSLVGGCRDAPTLVQPSERPPSRPAPALSSDDEALLASLLADDPGDFHVARARIWRIGPARWTTEGPELPNRSREDLRGGALDQPVEAVVVDAAGPRVLLPLDELGPRKRGSEAAEGGDALRLVAVLGASDLVAGLTRELRPTPWLTLAAGVGLTPLGREDNHLRVHWSDPACGFGLDLQIEPEAFGPLYEPGPAGRPVDGPEPREGPALRLAPGAQIYADADGHEPIVRLDPEAPSEGHRLSAAQRVTLIGEPSRELQHIRLRCRGVEIAGWVPRAQIIEIPGRYAIVEATPPPSSSCAGFDAEPILVPEATPLHELLPPEPTTKTRPGAGEPALIGVVAEDLELAATPGADGWWRACAPSPWGDLLFQFRLR